MTALRNIFLLLLSSLLLSGTGADYDKDLLPAEFHADRRDALRKLMPDSSVAVVFSAPEHVYSNDVIYPYHQDPDFYYLCGLREPNAVLVIFKEKRKVDSLFTNEILFVQKRDAKEESWTGKRLGASGARERLKITALETSAFDRIVLPWSSFSKVMFKPHRDDVFDKSQNTTDLFDLIEVFKRKTAGNSNNNTSLLIQDMAMLRQIKQEKEMELLRKAINISCDAHIRLMREMDSSMTEYQVQAFIEYHFFHAGAESTGYPSICGAGENSCILHYVTNRKPMENNELIVVDAGAEYHGYTADITRTLPANGRFTPEQKIIYDIVLDAQMAGIAACKKGNEFRDPHKAAVRVIKRRLKEIGVIQREEDYVQYFFHGTSHYLGLDVHDPGLYGPLEPGNVITVEPGIYIPEGSPCDPKWWNIGVRIEDDILITPGEPENLSVAAPKTTAEIEKIMAVE